MGLLCKIGFHNWDACKCTKCGVIKHNFVNGQCSKCKKVIEILVEGGTFNMGSIDCEEEKPIHLVTLSSYYIGKSAVTVREYNEYCKETGTAMPSMPSWGWNDNDPMVYVSWNDAQEYCKWAGVRLPTEAEWEFAARGGNKSKGFKYSGSNNLDDVAWTFNNSGGKVHEVGTKASNELGINDMSGNVSEWCNDWYGFDYYSKSESKDPEGPISGTTAVLRGGSWSNSHSEGLFSCTSRSGLKPSSKGASHGFRYVRTL